MKIQTRLRLCSISCILLRSFCITTFFSVILLPLGFFGAFSDIGNLIENPKFRGISIGITVLTETILFWTGIILVYLTAKQLGLRWRILGIICGWIPIAQLIMLHIIIKTALAEVKTERAKLRTNSLRNTEQICWTKYPILLVYGVFFRDFEHLNYWGRIPTELQKKRCYPLLW